MLTLDLLRYRVDGESVTPVYLTLSGGRRYVGMAQQIVDLYRAAVGRTVGELEADIEDTLGSAPDYKVYRGLAKMMSDYAEVEPPTDIDVEALRMQVFSLAAREGPLVRTADLLFHRTASDAAARIARSLDMPPQRLIESLYADLKENQVIRGVDESVTAEQLLQRYNTALAQAMLYRATRLIVDVYDSYRTVFKYIKLSRLMHGIRRHEDGYRIDIDGPMSLFANVERYGVAMAKLLPGVLKCRRWRLAARVNVGDGEKLFRLSPRSGLVSHYRDEPVFDSAPEEAFYNKFARNKKSKWRIEREGAVLDLGETVLIPDFRFVHEDGRIAYLEIVGFWTPEYLNRKLDKLARVREAGVVVAVPESLACADCEITGRVVRYKARLLIKDILPAIEETARPAGACAAPVRPE